MKLALSTRWNASRHRDGMEMVDEIRSLGLERIELGYDLRRDLVEGVRHAVDTGVVGVTSVHNFCPVPTAAPAGHPELFTLAHRDARVREQALRHTRETIRFAAEVGASVVVLHCGNVAMKRMTPKLFALAEQGRQDGKRYDKLVMKMLAKREKKAPRQIEYLQNGLEKLLSTLEEHDIKLGLENLPTWESIPTEMEMESLLNQIDSPHLGYWHDMGHGQVRENAGLSNHFNWLERLSPKLVGMHIHDVVPPAGDHVMPPKGDIDFKRFKPYSRKNIPLVLEPSPYIGIEDLRRGIEVLEDAWQ